MESLVQYAPFAIIGAYVLFVFVLFLSSKFRFKFFESHKEVSNYSWTRVMGTFLIASAIIIALAQILGNTEPNLALITSMIAVAVGGKVVQKKNEKGESFFTISKDPKSNDSEEHSFKKDKDESEKINEQFEQPNGCDRGCERDNSEH